MVKLPFGFSPVNAVKQVADMANPLNGKTDYDVFGDISVQGGDRNPVPSRYGGNVLGVGIQASPTVTAGASTNRGNPAADFVNNMANDRATGGSGAYGGGAGSAQAQADAEELAYLADQEALIRGLLNKIQGSYKQGYQSIDDSYNSAKAGATKQQSRALSDYALQREDTSRAQQSAIGKVDTNARTLAQSLQRLIGNASGSGSSAYQITAPGAVARDASLNRQGVQETYGTNFRDLGIAEDRTKDDYESLLEELASQRNTARRDFETGLGEQKIGVQGQLADLARQREAVRGGDYNSIRNASAPFQREIASTEAGLKGLFDKYRNPVKARKLEVSTPNLRDYVTNRAQIGGGQGAEQRTTNPTAPYTNYLGDPQDEENPLY